jgi:hypothetical protein
MKQPQDRFVWWVRAGTEVAMVDSRKFLGWWQLGALHQRERA